MTGTRGLGIGARRAGVKTKTPKRNPPKRDMGGRGQTKTETLLSSVSLALVLGGTCTTKSGRGEDEAQAASASSIAADLPTDSDGTADGTHKIQRYLSWIISIILFISTYTD